MSRDRVKDVLGAVIYLVLFIALLAFEQWVLK